MLECVKAKYGRMEIIQNRKKFRNKDFKTIYFIFIHDIFLKCRYWGTMILNTFFK